MTTDVIMQGRVDVFKDVYGKYFTIEGTVLKGNQKGKTLGFPTANIDAQPSVIPRRGMYGVRVHCEDKTHFGTMNIGMPLTSDNQEALAYETHILDFDGDLYGKKLQVELLFPIREERRFNSVEELKDQIGKDVQSAREKFSTFN